MTNTHKHKLPTQNEIKSLRNIYIENHTKKSFIVCLLVVYFPFPVPNRPPKLTLLKLCVSPSERRGAPKTNGVNIPKKISSKNYAQIILFVPLSKLTLTQSKPVATQTHTHICVPTGDFQR